MGTALENAKIEGKDEQDADMKTNEYPELRRVSNGRESLDSK